MLRTLALLILCAFSASAATLTGTVRNSTTNALAPNVDIVLISLSSGMDVLASTKSDAAGRFSFNNPAIGAGPVLVRANYKGVNYHANVPPGTTTAAIEIFENTADPAILEVESRYVVVQPNGPVLLVGEEYSIHNHANPPATFFNTTGTFEFSIPPGAELKEVSAWGPAAMPLVQGTIDRGQNRFALSFALKPGENGVRVSYQLPYATNQAVVAAPSPYAVKALAVIAPPQLQISGASLIAAGQQQGWNVYERRTVPAAANVAVSVSGTAPPPSADPEPASPVMPGGAPVAQPGMALQQIPARLADLQWILIAGFAALFFLGAFYLWKRPSPVLATAGTPLETPSRTPRRKSQTPPPTTPESISTPSSALDAAHAEVARQVSASLDELKDQIFRLELRRQAGTISDSDYSREKSRVEALLREFLKG